MLVKHFSDEFEFLWVWEWWNSLWWWAVAFLRSFQNIVYLHHSSNVAVKFRAPGGSNEHPTSSHYPGWKQFHGTQVARPPSLSAIMASLLGWWCPVDKRKSSCKSEVDCIQLIPKNWLCVLQIGLWPTHDISLKTSFKALNRKLPAEWNWCIKEDKGVMKTFFGTCINTNDTPTSHLLLTTKEAKTSARRRQLLAGNCSEWRFQRLPMASPGWICNSFQRRIYIKWCTCWLHKVFYTTSHRATLQIMPRE